MRIWPNVTGPKTVVLVAGINCPPALLTRTTILLGMQTFSPVSTVR
jgi:hypothetical protein